MKRPADSLCWQLTCPPPQLHMQRRCRQLHCNRAATRSVGMHILLPCRLFAVDQKATAFQVAPEQQTTAVLIVDHGSRRAGSNSMLESFAELYRQHSRRDTVRTAHMEIAEPSILSAVTTLAQEGYRDIVIAPYFLSPGRHITEDIPALMAEAQQANPGTSITLADPIGLDPLMAEIIEQRVARVLGEAQPGTAIALEKE